MRKFIKNRTRALFVLGILSGCASTSPWKLDTIACGNKEYDSARLAYEGSPLRLEFIKLGEQIDLFVSLTQYHFTPLPEDASSACVQLSIAGQTAIEEIVSLLQGQMRLHFPKETADKIVKALQEGQTVDMLIDGFQETLQPELFVKSYEKFTGV